MIYETKIGFIGLGKLGMPCAEAIAKKGFDVTGYDIVPKSSDKITIKQTIKELVEDRDIVFVATPTPHEDGYDGRTPTSHLPVKDFNYTEVKQVLSACDKHMRLGRLTKRPRYPQASARASIHLVAGSSPSDCHHPSSPPPRCLCAVP